MDRFKPRLGRFHFIFFYVRVDGVGDLVDEQVGESIECKLDYSNQIR